MLFESIGLATLGVSLPIYASKTKYSKVDETIKKQIEENGLYHFASEDVVDKILESKHIKPSSRTVSYSFNKKVFMFNGLPNMDVYKKNIPLDCNPYLNEIYKFCAVKVNPDKNDLEKLKIRDLNDHVITKDGKYILEEGTNLTVDNESQNLDNKAKKVFIGLVLNDKGEIEFQELENEKEYIPSEELVKKLSEIRSKNNSFKEGISQLKAEWKCTKTSVKAKMQNFMERFIKNDKLMLNEASSLNSTESLEKSGSEENKFKNELEDLTYDITELQADTIDKEDEQEIENKEVNEKENEDICI